MFQTQNHTGNREGKGDRGKGSGELHHSAIERTRLAGHGNSAKLVLGGGTKTVFRQVQYWQRSKGCARTGGGGGGGGLLVVWFGVGG